ncbi:MAG TPA: hypothetical protein VFU21_07160 [Kofleriaceae bacterium]|nr:hypothetical protein [Kofleriaceae bacterium]
MKMTSLLIACGLALAPAACKKDKDDDGVPSPKSVESAEKEAMEAKSDLADEREDVAEERKDVAEQADDVGAASADFAKERDEFVAKAKARMSTVEARLNALKADLKTGGAKLKAETRGEVDELMKDIAEEQAKAKAAFEAASSGAKDRWDELEKNTGEALEDLEDKANALAEKMKDGGIKLRAEAEAADK